MIPRRLLALSAAVCLLALSPSATRGAEPVPGATIPKMPLSEVRPGMEGVVRTIFEGDNIEEFKAEIVAVMSNFLGPNQDLILARLKGPRVEFTGVAAGMSGSPVYIDGRLVGALSYRLGSFMKEPIAGITPIEYMLDVNPEDTTPGPGTTVPAEPVAATMPGGLEPIESPLMISGVPSTALAEFAPDLKRLGLSGALMGAAGSGGVAAGVAGAPPQLVPGDAVAAELISGDVSFAATGTVTAVEGNRVFAFGHPAFLSGATELPMARARIYMTMPSLQASNKLGQVLDTIGTFRQSRLPAMTGLIGPKPRMIPVDLELTGFGGLKKHFHYEVVDHQMFTPTLLGMVTAASLMNTPGFSDEMTLALSGRFELEGLPDLVLNDVYTGFSASQSPAVALARDVQGLFSAVFQNRFEKPNVRAVRLSVGSVEKANLSVVEAVYPTRTELDPGDPVEFRVLIRPYRGEAYTRTFSYRLPEGTPSGPMIAYVGGSNVLEVVERNTLTRQVRQADGLGQIISLVNRLRTSDRLYLKIIRRHEGAIVQNEILPSPASIHLLDAQRQPWNRRGHPGRGHDDARGVDPDEPARRRGDRGAAQGPMIPAASLP